MLEQRATVHDDFQDTMASAAKQTMARNPEIEGVAIIVLSKALNYAGGITGILVSPNGEDGKPKGFTPDQYLRFVSNLCTIGQELFHPVREFDEKMIQMLEENARTLNGQRARIAEEREAGTPHQAPQTPG